MKKAEKKYAEKDETPELESKSHSKGFLKKALADKSAGKKSVKK